MTSTSPQLPTSSASRLSRQPDAARIDRSEIQSERQPATLTHDSLLSRSASVPHGGTRAPRAGLPPHPHTTASPGSDTRSMLASSVRSDHLSVEAFGPSSPDADYAHDLEMGVEEQPAPERSWRQLASELSTLVWQGLGNAGEQINQGLHTAGEQLSQGLHTAGEGLQTAAGQLNHGLHVAADGLREGGRVAGQQLVESGQALGVTLPKPRLLGAALGHLSHQSITVGVPTFAREMMAEGMLLSMRNMPANHAMILQVGIGVINVGAQVVREWRERRNPEAAARGFHGLSPDQWNQLPESEKVIKRAEQRRHSRMITLMQVTASVTNVTVGALAATVTSADADKAAAMQETASRLFVTDFKTMVYSGMRDSLQASFSMVGSDSATFGVNGAHMVAAANFYGGANIAGNYAFTVLPGLVPNAKLANQVLRGQSDAMTHGEAWKVKAAVSAVKAAINTVLETADWFSVTQQEVNQAGTVQRWNPKLKFLKAEDRDYGRLLDQTPARMLAIGGSNAMYNAISFALRDQPQAVQDLVANVVVGGFAGVQYKTIGGTWQADGAVRAEPRPPAP